MAGQAAFAGAALYHASKWGIEGFIDAVGQEVAPFGIECTLIEPSSARTQFFSRGVQLATRIPAYDVSPAVQARNYTENAPVPPGDPVKRVQIMIAGVDQSPAPRRVAMGKAAYTAMHNELSDRLAAVEAQRELAF